MEVTTSTARCKAASCSDEASPARRRFCWPAGRLKLGVGAGEQSGFVEVRPVGFKNESRHAFR